MLIADALLWGGWFLLGGETCPASAGHSGSSPYKILVPQHPESRARDGQACTASSPRYQLQVMSKDLCVAKVRTLLGPDDGIGLVLVWRVTSRSCLQGLVLPTRGYISKSELQRATQCPQPECDFGKCGVLAQTGSVG